MSPFFRLRRTKWAIELAEHGFMVAGVLALGYCLAVYVNAELFQTRQARDFFKAVHLREVGKGTPSIPTTLAIPKDGAVFGRLEIPRLGVSVMVVEGAEDADLKRAVGHIPGTALPGEPGNVGIAGHRDTFFRPLRRIQPNDTITLDTFQGAYRYRVMSTEVVRPEDIQVLYPTRHDSLTLVTCFPFDYIGSAPKRFIVRAEREHDLVVTSLACGIAAQGAAPAAAQKVNRVCNSSRRLLAFSEKIPPPDPAGWLAWPNSGDVMLPMIGPGLLWLVTLRICIEMVRP